MKLKKNFTWYKSLWSRSTSFWILSSISDLIVHNFRSVFTMHNLLDCPQPSWNFVLSLSLWFSHFFTYNTTMAKGKQQAASTIDSDHSLFFHLSDTTGLSLASFQLTRAENYSIWRRGMMIDLLARNKLGFINGTCKKEDLDKSFHHLWDMCNAYIFAWIMNVVSIELFNIIIYSTTAFHVWNDLKEKSDKVNDIRIYQLHWEIFVTQQGIDSITVYFNKMRLIWDEFAAFITAIVTSSRSMWNMPII